MNIKDIIKHELIGLNIEIINSKNKSNIGIKGKIIDETKHTLKIKKGDKIKTVFKKNIILKTKVNNHSIKIDGYKLVKRSYERVK